MRGLVTILLLSLSGTFAVAEGDCAGFAARIDEMVASGAHDAQAVQTMLLIKQQIAAVCQAGGPQMAEQLMASIDAEVETQALPLDELSASYLRGPWCLGRPGEGEVVYYNFREDGGFRRGGNSWGFRTSEEAAAYMANENHLEGDKRGNRTGSSIAELVEFHGISKLESKDEHSFVAVGRHNARLTFERGACWK